MLIACLLHIIWWKWHFTSCHIPSSSPQLQSNHEKIMRTIPIAGHPTMYFTRTPENSLSLQHFVWLSHVWLFATPWTIWVTILVWVAVPFFRGSSQPRDWTQVSHIAGRLFTSWATREAQEHWSGQPIPPPANLPDPGIEPGSPALQDSLPTELWGKPSC